jgi:hypothetical protein
MLETEGAIMYTITEKQIKVSNRKMGIAFSVVFSVVFFIAVIRCASLFESRYKRSYGKIA